jgi:hypothetical protein
MRTRVQSEASPRGICGKQSDTETSFSPSFSILLCQYHLVLIHSSITDDVYNLKKSERYSISLPPPPHTHTNTM